MSKDFRDRGLSSMAVERKSILRRGNSSANALLQELPGMFGEEQGGQGGGRGGSKGRVVDAVSDGRLDCSVGYFKPG